MRSDMEGPLLWSSSLPGGEVAEEGAGVVQVQEAKVRNLKFCSRARMAPFVCIFWAAAS